MDINISVLKEIKDLYLSTPVGNLLRYTFKNCPQNNSLASNLKQIELTGAIKIYKYEIDVEGENIFDLQVLNGGIRLKELFEELLSERKDLDKLMNLKPLKGDSVRHEERNEKGYTVTSDGYEICLGSASAIPSRGMKILTDFSLGASLPLETFAEKLYSDKLRKKLGAYKNDHEKITRITDLVKNSFIKTIQKNRDLTRHIKPTINKGRIFLVSSLSI